VTDQRSISARIYDSHRRRLVPVPLSEDAGGPAFRLYVCGVTPYDSGHLGHAFTFTSFDVLVRWLEASGVRVTYVQNVTDVDDPLFERARRDGVEWRELAERETERFVRDMDALGWRPPDVMPRVSKEIEGIEAAVERLADAGYAYRTDAVYFDVSRYPGYGELSHRTRRSMLRKLREEGLLGRVGPDAKRDALDFPLWRASAPDEPSWEAPFGAGRPGWHIECSAMAMRYLGPRIDVHGGGRDLAFSHHESERAQSEAMTGERPFASAWMHTGMVRYEGAKMSKSLGNLVVVSDLLNRVPAAAGRLSLLSHRYRTDWSFEWARLERPRGLVERLRALLETEKVRPSARPGSGRAGELADAFAAAMDDDLNTPRAIAVLDRAVRLSEREAAGWMAGILCGDASLS
jgi:L-cysteine:1D-myo-inositol 2-amino-2-deoxy-alpha-D-glucopyranoside ligase